MADWIPPQIVQPNTEGSAEQINTALFNIIAAFAGAEGAPRLDIKSLSVIEITNATMNSNDTRRLFYSLENILTADQFPIAAWVFGLDRNGDDIREFYPATGRLIPLDFNELVGDYASGVPFPFGKQIRLYRVDNSGSAGTYDMDAYIYYYNRAI